MRKLVLINIVVLLALGCATVPVQDEVNVNYYAIQSEFRRSSSDWNGRTNVDFYLTENMPLEQVNTIALLPAGYVDDYEDEYELDSANFPDKEWIDSFSQSIKAKLVKGDFGKYIHSSVIDTTSEWNKKVDFYSYRIYTDLKWVKIKATTKSNKKEPTRELIDSLKKIYDAPDQFVITPSAIDSYIDNSEFYRDNRIRDKYAPWGGKAFYDLICDSLTEIVQSEILSKGLFKLIPPPITKNDCDSICRTLDKDGQSLWYTWFYPNPTLDSCDYPNIKTYYYSNDEKTKKQLAETILQCLGADAYIVIDISFDKPTKMTLGKRDKCEIRRQLFLKISVIGPEFNALWSADFPISKQIRWSAYFPTNKEMENKYAYEIIDYNMARENVKRVLSLILSNKSGIKFQ